MPTLLLTNDDGIEAPGLAALAAAAATLGEVIVVAPRDHLSGCSHCVTTDRPLRLERRRPGWYAVDGSPADCVRVALGHVAPAADWVLSGVNEGGNLGVDVLFSGTVAAAREAALAGRRAAAISHYRRPRAGIDWERAARRTARVLAELFERPGGVDGFWNVNLPHPAADDDRESPLIECPCDVSPLPVRFEADGEHFHYRGDYHARRRTPAADVDICFGGQIAVSWLPLAPR